MTVHAVRGTKRTCQNEECGVRFYDLTRNPIACPICHSPFVPPLMRDPAAAPRTNRAPFHRPSSSSAQVAKTTTKESELPPAADDFGDADTKIEPENADAILEPEEEDGDSSSGVPLPKDERE